jgi:hypothetical protein
MRIKLTKSAVALSLALSACSLAPNYQRPPMEIPAGWSSPIGTAGQNDKPFWQDLGSDELNRLIDNVLAQNLDLEAALHRIEQARAQAKVAAAPLYPSVSASGSAAHTFQNPQDKNAAAGGANLSYEVDLWGKNRNQAQSADYRIDVSQFDREALRLVVTADATNFYSQILSLNDRIAIAEYNLKSAEEILRIVEARYNAGSVSGLVSLMKLSHRKPALIACCTEAEQVADAISFARRSGLEIAVRGGGHSHAGHSACDGGLMIHLGAMNGVVVDPAARRADRPPPAAARAACCRPPPPALRSDQSPAAVAPRG